VPVGLLLYPVPAGLLLYPVPAGLLLYPFTLSCVDIWTAADEGVVVVSGYFVNVTQVVVPLSV